MPILTTIKTTPESGDNVVASDDNEEDDEDLQEEDLDIFLVNLEARLRADFTSFDLSSVISSQGSSSSSSSSLLSTPAKFLRLLHKVFHRAVKSIKLRALISVMGLDNDDAIGTDTVGGDGGMRRNNNNYINSTTASNSSDDDDDDGGRKTDAIVWKLLSHAMKKDDEIWVRVIAEIIRNIMFQRRKTKLTNNNNNSKKSGNVDADASDDDTLELEKESKLHKVSETILRGIEEACVRAQKRYDSAVKQGMQQYEDNQELMEQQPQEQQQSLATLLIGADIDPFYVPLRYHLLPSKIVRAILPEFEPSSTTILQQHFTPNMNSDILNMDDSYVEEEGTVMIAPVVASAQHSQQPQKGGVTAGGSIQVPDRVNVVDRGRFANSGRGVKVGGTSSLFRPSTNTSIAAGRGGASTGRGRMGGVGQGMGGRLAVGVGRGAGGGRSLASLVAGGMGRGGIAGRGAVVNTTTAARGRGGMAVAAAAAGSGTKMKVIDIAEIQGLAQAAQVKNDVSGLSSVELRKLERKRKLLEDAAASGLKKSR